MGEAREHTDSRLLKSWPRNAIYGGSGGGIHTASLSSVEHHGQKKKKGKRKQNNITEGKERKGEEGRRKGNQTYNTITGDHS